MPPVSDAVTLLSACTLLSWFDATLLEIMGVADESTILGFLTSDAVIAHPSLPDRYTLRPEAAAAQSPRLSADPDLEIALHQRIVGAFLQRLAARPPSEGRAMQEDACFHHLDRLFYLLNGRGEWQTISDLAHGAGRVGPLQPRHQQRLLLYHALAALYLSTDLTQAEPLFHDLLAQPDLEGNTHLRALNGLAILCGRLMRYEEAITLGEQLYELALAQGDLYFQAAALINKGTYLNDLGYYEEALKLTEQSLARFRQLGDLPRETYALYEMGNNALYLGRWEEALRYLDEAAALAEQQRLFARLAYIRWGQGLLFHLIGEWEKSEIAYQEALALIQSPSIADPKQHCDILWHLGFLYHTQERWGEALAAYEAARDLAERWGRTHWLSLIHYRRGDLFERQGRPDEARAAYALAIEQIEALRGATRAEKLKLGLLRITPQIYEAMVRLLLARGEEAEAFHYVERARSRALLDSLSERDPAFEQALAQGVVRLEEVQAALPEGTLLLEYFTTGVVPPGEMLIRNLPPTNARLRTFLVHPAAIFLFCISRDGATVHRITLDPNKLQPQGEELNPVRRLLNPRQLTALHSHLLGPVAERLAHQRLLYLIPHGPLHYVPFVALASPNGEPLLSESGPALAFAPSATVLLRRCLEAPERIGTDFLALGYNDQGEEELQFAEAEAEMLARRMGGSAWTGATPKAARLLAQEGPLGWLHVSGHFFFQRHEPLNSVLRLGPKETLTARDIRNRLAARVGLVTLSACASGLNHIVPGDELLGLPQAFLLAGAPTVICAAVEIPDLIALLVMEPFCRAVQAGQPPAIALRDAQVALRQMTGRDLQAIQARWRAEYPDICATLPFPQVEEALLETPLYAETNSWPLFMLVGRG